MANTKTGFKKFLAFSSGWTLLFECSNTRLLCWYSSTIWSILYLWIVAKPAMELEESTSHYQHCVTVNIHFVRQCAQLGNFWETEHLLSSLNLLWIRGSDFLWMCTCTTVREPSRKTSLEFQKWITRITRTLVNASESLAIGCHHQHDV